MRRPPEAPAGRTGRTWRGRPHPGRRPSRHRGRPHSPTASLCRCTLSSGLMNFHCRMSSSLETPLLESASTRTRVSGLRSSPAGNGSRIRPHPAAGPGSTKCPPVKRHSIAWRWPETQSATARSGWAAGSGGPGRARLSTAAPSTRRTRQALALAIAGKVLAGGVPLDGPSEQRAGGSTVLEARVPGAGRVHSRGEPSVAQVLAERHLLTLTSADHS